MWLDVMGIVVVLYIAAMLSVELFGGNQFFHT